MTTAWITGEHLYPSTVAPFRQHYELDILKPEEMNGQLPNYDLILVDIREGGLPYLEQVLQHAQGTPVIVASPYSAKHDRRIPEIADKVESMGAIGFIDTLENRNGYRMCARIEDVLENQKKKKGELVAFPQQEAPRFRPTIPLANQRPA